MTHSGWMGLNFICDVFDHCRRCSVHLRHQMLKIALEFFKPPPTLWFVAQEAQQLVALSFQVADILNLDNEGRLQQVFDTRMLNNCSELCSMYLVGN